LLFLVLTSLLIIPSPVVAEKNMTQQNLIKNGDFEQGLEYWHRGVISPRGSGYPIIRETANRTIRIDGDPSDWRGIDPLATDPQDLFDVGAPRPVADLKEVYATFDEEYLYFMAVMWGMINLDTRSKTLPEPGEYVTSLYIRIAFAGNQHAILAWLHPLWGRIWSYVSVNRDLTEDFEKETNRLAPLEYAYQDNVVEERIPISLLGSWGFRSPETTSLRFYSAAWHPLAAGGYGGVFDGTDPQWVSFPGASAKPPVAVATLTMTLTTVSIQTTSFMVPVPVQPPWHWALLTSVVGGLVVASITWMARKLRRQTSPPGKSHFRQEQSVMTLSDS
jgi:hypothetical protein